MKKLFVNILCAFIPSKILRHKIRNYYINKQEKPNTHYNNLLNEIKNCSNNVINEIKGYTTECYWANVFHDTILNSSWFTNKKVSPGRSAVSYIVLYIIYRILDEIKPQDILECGLGQSSKLLVQYTDTHKTNLMLCENNETWANFFYKQFPTAKNYVQLMEAKELEVVKPYKSRTYVNFEKYIKDKKFDFIFIDGPVGSENFSRPQLLDVANHLKPSFVIMLDDMNRNGEIQTWNKLKELLQSKNIDFVERVYYSDKGVGLICSPDLIYLTTL